MSPVLKINLDEYDIYKLNELSAFLFRIGENKQAMKVEAYIKEHGL
jgi:hypothetical protein